MAFIKPLLLTVFLAVSTTACAQINKAKPKAVSTPRMDLSLIEVTPHEIALTQVMAEICPSMLNSAQKHQFAKAYDTTIQSFMPALNPKLALVQLEQQKQYQAILTNIRMWTMSFSKEDNRELCVEFAESDF